MKAPQVFSPVMLAAAFILHHINIEIKGQISANKIFNSITTLQFQNNIIFIYSNMYAYLHNMQEQKYFVSEK